VFVRVCVCVCVCVSVIAIIHNNNSLHLQRVTRKGQTTRKKERETYRPLKNSHNIIDIY